MVVGFSVTGSAQTLLNGLEGDPTAFRISDDEGRTWKKVDMPESNGAVHANVVELEGGKLDLLSPQPFR